MKKLSKTEKDKLTILKGNFFLLQFWNSSSLLFAMLPMGITGIGFNVFMPLFTIADVILTNNGMKNHIVNY